MGCGVGVGLSGQAGNAHAISPSFNASAPSPTTWSRLFAGAPPRLLRERGNLTLTHVPYVSVLALLVVDVVTMQAIL